MRVLTAVQPTNQITIGNYLGAIREVVRLQNEGHEVLLFIADLHSITVSYDQKQLSKNVLNTLATYLACGVDPEKTTIFLQSNISEHSQLKHLLSPFVSYGDLTRMHQFEDKKDSQQYVSLALLDYPVLMAADILLYKPELIPVGADQVQHIELMRSVAQRFNLKHEYFKIPKSHTSSMAKVMSLQNPEKKMSKSDPNQMATIFMNDLSTDVEKKFKRAITDSESKIEYSAERSRVGVKNLLDINSALSNRSIPDLLSHFDGKRYGDLKLETAQVVNDYLNPIRTKINDHLNDEKGLKDILNSGNKKAKKIAQEKLNEIMKIMGFDLYND